MGMMQQMFASFLTTSGSPGSNTDSLFNYVSLLLNGETPSASFIADASTNNSALVPNGSARNDIFSPFAGGNYSVQFNGTSDQLTLPTTFASNLGTNDFTCEAWVNADSTGAGSNRQIVYFDGFNNGYVGLAIMIDSANLLSFTLNGYLTANITTAWALYNRWVHIAVVRQGSVFTAYVNGTSVGTYTNAAAMPAYTINNIGAYNNSYYYFKGFISNVRLVNGTAVYTSAFTPPTASLTAISGTSILTCQSARFIDNSTNNFAITTNGTPKISPKIPFTYTPVSASGYFNGTTDYVTSTYNAGLLLGTNNFTIEGWVYFNSVAAAQRVAGGDNPTAANNFNWAFYTNAAGTLSYYISSNSTAWTIGPVAVGTVAVGQWYHVALVRNGNVFTPYLNGVAGTPTTNSLSLFASTFGVTIGNQGTSWFGGYVSNFRLVNGTAVYTSAFTPPTTPLTAVTNTQLLTLQNQGPANNNGFLDSSGNDLALTRNGTPTQGTFSPFSQSGWSGYFNGTTDYLTSASSAAYTFGTADFTVEGWVYMTSFNTVANGVFQQGTSNFPASTTNSVAFGTGSTTTWQIYAKNAAATTSGVPAVAPVLNQWTHFAVVRASSVTTLYINGVVGLAVTADTTNYTGTYFGIGSIYGTPAGDLFPGYISNVRVVKGTAVYTSAFTPPTAPLIAISGTSLLTCQSARFVDNSTNKFAMTASGTPSTRATSPFEPTTSYSPSVNGGSIYFNGTTDYLVPPTDSAFVFGVSNFTVECWTYQTTNAAMAIFGTGSGASTNPYFYMNGLVPTIFYNNTQIATGPSIVLNTWNHIAFVRTGGNTFTIYVNGVAGTAGTFANSLTAAGAITVGTASNATQDFAGYISNLRVINGTAVYTSAFTPPTAPLTAIANTSLLLNATNGGVIDAASKNDTITVSTARSTSSIFKYGTSSLKFNGSSDYLAIPSSTQLYLGVGDFTVEAWVYFNSTAGTYVPFLQSAAMGTGSSDMWFMAVTGGALRFMTHSSGSYNASTPWTPSTGQWYHIAATRAAGNTQLYINGTAGTMTGGSSGSNYVLNQNGPIIGAISTPYYFNGYIDDLRITKGVARYTGTFTPPAAAFPTR